MTSRSRIAWTFAATAPVVLVAAVVIGLAVRSQTTAEDAGLAAPLLTDSEDEELGPVVRAGTAPAPAASPEVTPSPTASELLPNTAEEDKDPALGPIYSIEEFAVGYGSVEELTRDVDQMFVGTVVEVGAGSSNAWNIYEAITVKVDPALSGAGAPSLIQFEDIAREATTNRPVVALDQLDMAVGDRVLLFLNEESSTEVSSRGQGEPVSYSFPNRQTMYRLEDALGAEVTAIAPDTAIVDTGRTDSLIEQIESYSLAQLLQEVEAARQ